MVVLVRCHGNRCLIAVLAIALTFSRMVAVNAFIPSPQKPKQHHMAGFLDKFFDGLANNNNEFSGQTGARGEIVEDIDGIYTGSKRIITIPGKLKV